MISIDDNISSVERKLEEFFLTLNHNYFGDMLDKPLIVIKSDLKNSQKISTNKIWSNEKDEYYEISISAGLLNKSIVDIVVAITTQSSI